MVISVSDPFFVKSDRLLALGRGEGARWRSWPLDMPQLGGRVGHSQRFAYARYFP